MQKRSDQVRYLQDSDVFVQNFILSLDQLLKWQETMVKLDDFYGLNKSNEFITLKNTALEEVDKLLRGQNSGMDALTLKTREIKYFLAANS